MADDLRRLAEQAEPDEASAEDQAAELLAALGISAVPPDRGLSLVTRLEDCPLPGGYAIPEPYLVAADGIHLARGRRRGVRPGGVGVAIPGRSLRRPGRGPPRRAGLA